MALCDLRHASVFFRVAPTFVIVVEARTRVRLRLAKTGTETEIEADSEIATDAEQPKQRQ